MTDKAKFIEARARGKNRKEAAKAANPDLTDGSAEVVGHRLDKDPEVRLAIQKTAAQALEDAGLGIDDFIETIKEARTATKVIVMGKGTDDSFVDVVPDWNARLKATEMGLKLLQAYTVQKAPDPPGAPAISEDIKQRIKQGDVAALERIVFKDQS